MDEFFNILYNSRIQLVSLGNQYMVGYPLKSKPLITYGIQLFFRLDWSGILNNVYNECMQTTTTFF